jgi:hypothetical protein
MPRGRPKKQRIIIPKEGEEISKKALKNSLAVFWGCEPVFKPLNPLLKGNEAKLEYQSALGKAFNWYNAMTEEKNRKTFIIDYTEKNFPELLKNINHISPDLFVCGEGHALSICARLILRGWPVDDKHIQNLEKCIRNWSKVSVSTDDLFTEKTVIRDHKVSECIGVVNGMLDDFGYTKKHFPDNSMADAVLKLGITNNQKTKIHEHFSNLIVELKQAIDGKNSDIKESYEGVSKIILKKMYEWLIGAPSEELLKTVRKTRKPRTLKRKTPAQLLKLFVYQKSDDELKMGSTDPEDIIGAQQLWVFNTKTRKLGVYYAVDEKGLTVSRKSIDNYNEKTSFCKKLRKPKEILPKVAEYGKVALRHLMDEIRAKSAPMRSRICDTVLLLRTVK